MRITVDSRAPAETPADLLAVPIGAAARGKRRLEARLAAIDRAARGAIEAALESGDFRGKAGETLLLYPGGRLKARRLLLLGLGEEKQQDDDAFRKLAGRAVGEAMRRRASRVALLVPPLMADTAERRVQALAEGAVLADYRFDDYRSAGRGEGGSGSGSEKEAEEKPIASLSLLVASGVDLRAVRAAAKRGEVVASSQNAARRLSDMPPNALPPATLAEEVRKLARETGLRVKVLDVPALQRLGAGGILAVGGGSAHPPRLIAIQYTPPGAGGRKKTAARKAARGTAPIALVGKGITFDSGGISIKPSAGMDEMKHDMSGAAAVVGTLRACALLKLPLPVVGVIGAAENLPSGTAYRPGDVVTAMSGKTIEVLNTDAEGRVVLADALHYARTEYEPCAIVDLATLTGACVVALGSFATGLFGNDEKLVARVRDAGDRAAERAWPMPLLDGHKEEIRSQIADIKNTGGRSAGASTAAAFLSHFVGETPWVHLDIAGTGWTSTAGPYQRKGATGVGVRLLLELLRSWGEPEAEA